MAAFRDTFAMQLRQLEKLPMLPQMLWELEAAFQNRAMGAIEIADLIEKDLSLTATLLKVSNSAFFRGNAEFITVRDAVVRVGLNETRRLTRAMLLVDALSHDGGSMDYDEYWRHGLLVGVAASFLQEYAFPDSPLLPDEAYLAGLLHDIGKLVLDQYFEPENDRVTKYVQDHGGARHDAERIELGVDHGVIGAELLELWGLPDKVIEPVRWHHAVQEAPEEWRHPAALIAAANAICHERESRLIGVDDEPDPFPGLNDARSRELRKELDREERLLRIITAV